MDDHPDYERSTVGLFLARLFGAFVPLGAALWRSFRRRPLDSLGFLVGTAAAGAILINALFMQASPHPAPMLPGKPRPVAAETTAGARERARATERQPAADAPGRSRQQIVSDIQRELSRRGFFDGPVDGVYGAKTDAAIRDFEQAAGLKTNAQPDEALLRTIARSPLRAAPLPPLPPAAPAAPAVASVPLPSTTTPSALPMPLARPAGAPHAPAPQAAASAPARRTVAAVPAAAAPAAPAAPARHAVAAAPAAGAAAAHPVPPAPVGSPSAPSRRIVAVQRALADFGYGPLKANGVVGSETTAAIERFERERKLPATGQISDRLVRELAAVTGRPLE